MKIGHGIITKSVNLNVDTPPTEQNLDDQLNSVLSESYSDWQASGRKRTWNQTDGSHVLIITGNSYEQVMKRLRALAKERGLSLRIGKPLASEQTNLFIPVLALDPSESKPRAQTVESSAFTLSGNDWKDILFALRQTIQHLINDSRRDDLARIESKIMTAMGNELPSAEVRALEP